MGIILYKLCVSVLSQRSETKTRKNIISNSFFLSSTESEVTNFETVHVN